MVSALVYLLFSASLNFVGMSELHIHIHVHIHIHMHIHMHVHIHPGGWENCASGCERVEKKLLWRCGAVRILIAP